MTSRALRDVAYAVDNRITTGGVTDLRYMVWPLKNTVYIAMRMDYYCAAEFTNIFIDCIHDLGDPRRFVELIELADFIQSD